MIRTMKMTGIHTTGRYGHGQLPFTDFGNHYFPVLLGIRFSVVPVHEDDRQLYIGGRQEYFFTGHGESSEE